MGSNARARGEALRAFINEDADSKLASVPEADQAERATIEAERADRLTQADKWVSAKEARDTEVWQLNNVSEKHVADRIAAIRNARAEWDKFKRDQRAANEWISFDRALRCLIGQKDIATAEQATRLLLDDIRAGKFHQQNANTSTLTAVIGPGASTPDEAKGVYWTPADFDVILNAKTEIRLQSVLADIHFAREPWLRWMRESGFVPTADIERQFDSLATHTDAELNDTGELDDTEAPIMVQLPSSPPKQRMQAVLHKALAQIYGREMPYPKSNEALKRIANKRLEKMLKAGDVFPEESEVSVNTVGRYLKKITRSANQPIRQK